MKKGFTKSIWLSALALVLVISFKQVLLSAFRGLVLGYIYLKTKFNIKFLLLNLIYNYTVIFGASNLMKMLICGTHI
jgi:hypothetical protein